MKAFTALSAFAGAIALAHAQITQGADGAITCPATGGSFCAGGSLATNIIIRCQGTTAEPGNCNDNLAGVPPIGVKTDALCYQSSATAGDAECVLNGTVPSNSTSTVSTGSTTSVVGVSGTTTTAPFGNGTMISASAPTSSSTTVVVVCSTCTATLPGTTITGAGNGAAPSTITTLVPASTGSSSSGSGSSGSGSGSGSGSSGSSSTTPAVSPLPSGSIASGMQSNTGMGICAGVLAAIMAFAMI